VKNRRGKQDVLLYWKRKLMGGSFLKNFKKTKRGGGGGRVGSLTEKKRTQNKKKKSKNYGEKTKEQRDGV